MDREAEGAIAGRLAALEQVAVLLIAEQVKALPEGDRPFFMLKLAARAQPPATSDIDVADRLAGMTIAFEEALDRMLTSVSALVED